MRGSSILVCVSALAFACSGGEKKTSTPVAKSDGGNGSVNTSSGDDAGKTDPGEPLSSGECSELLRHVLTISMNEKEAEKAAADRLADEQIAEVVETVHREMVANDEEMARCQAQPRWAFECAMAATSTSAIAACQSN